MKSLKWTKRSGKDSYAITFPQVTVDAWLYKSGDNCWRLRCSVNGSERTFYIGAALTVVEAKKLALQEFREWINKTWEAIEIAGLVVAGLK